MTIRFDGKWKGIVIGRNAGFSQRVEVTGAASGNGACAGVVGNSFVVQDGNVELQWNDNGGSGWQPSAVVDAIGMTSPLVVVRFLSADDNVPAQRDGDYDDLQVMLESLDAPFEVPQRPFALERGSLAMMPDGIFDTSQGVQYMGVRIRNTWFWDWQSDFPATGMKIGIAPASRTALAAAGITVLDAWSPQEQQALGQTVDGGYVRVPDLRVGEETMIYFKVDVSAAAPSKPAVGFVAQRDAFDPHFDASTRVVNKKIFISRSSYDHDAKELVAEVPEGVLRMKLSSIKVDPKAAQTAAKDLLKCLRRSSSGAGGGTLGGRDPADLFPLRFWQDCRDTTAVRNRRGNALLRRALKEILTGRDIDLCALKEIIDRTCATGTCKGPCGCGPGHGGPGGGKDGQGFPGGGWQEGTGLDGWCRVKPIAWLPVSFEYRIEPNPAYTGQYGPLPFEDPWWKVILLIIALLLAIASLIYDYVEAGQDPKFIIGKIVRNGDANTNAVDCAVCDLNGSRMTDLGELDAQGDDINNGSPIEGAGNIIQLDRTDNGDSGIQDAVLGSVVWKSGSRSATTRGMVDSVTFASNVSYESEDTISGTVNYTNQVHVTQITGMEQPLSQGGDSGSVWVDMATKRAVALNFAGDLPDAGTEGVGNPIRAVVDRLQIRFNP